MAGPLQQEGEAGDKHEQADTSAKPSLHCRVDEGGRRFTALRVHAGRKAFADQPGDDQHHALDAKGDHARQQRFAGKIAHAVPGRVSRRQGQHDAGGAKKRQLPVGKHGFFKRRP